MELLHYIEDLGNLSLNIFWLPLLLWTAMGLLAVLVMKVSEKVHSVFQYHGRIALLFALPAGIIFSGLNHWFNLFVQSSGQIATKFIVIQSPITVGIDNASQTLNWTSPAFISGLLLTILISVSLLFLIRVAKNFIELRNFALSLNTEPLKNFSWITENNILLSEQIEPNITVAFSDRSQVPFTFGSRKPVIVIPNHLKQEYSDKLNMAVRHELMHIKHRDFSINSLMMFVKAVFWFHPLIHKLYNGLKEYREISCDQEVLSDNTISKKFYAQLLFELAAKKPFESTPAVSMAVNSSTLKKRIQLMSSQKRQKSMFKTSFYIMLVSALFMSGIMACTDLQDNGITNSEVESAQRQMTVQKDEMKPLFVLDGEIIRDQATKNKLAGVKTKYIESINVLKGEKAVSEYGSEAKNGVIEFQLLDKELAFSDLKAPPAPGTKAENPSAKEDHFVVVEKMPELKGGMAELQQKVSYPEAARNAGIEGRVIVQFIVNEEGQVENPQIIKGIGGGADEEALRVVKQTEFTPGYQKGQPVRVQYSLPIIFKLSENKSE